MRALPTAEASAQDLTRLIFADLSSGAIDYASVISLGNYVRARSHDDFRNGRTVTVDGWMLSQTEARVYALAGFLVKSAP